ncbi:hypothetical protein [Streptomyces sp. NPDC088726]|uniref:hypothetical protein n=1 Tax=Streptomyces sp. NPDC088726 TaxID=3365874 RepID=UPI00380A4899
MDTTPTTDRVRSAAQRALQSLEALIADTTDPGVEALGARHELATALLNTSPAPARLVLGTTDQQPETTPADRRARYAAAIRALNEGGGTLADLDETSDVLTLADAVMAVADAEQQELRAEVDKLIRWRKEDSTQAVKAQLTITRLRGERAELNRRLSCLQGDMRDMEAHVRGQDTEFERLPRLADEAQQTETEDDDPICGNQYDDEVCELEPEHPGAHCTGTVCWDYEPAPAPTEEPRQRPTPFECEPGNRCHACAVCWS